jgi:hypothetical protein
MRRAAVTWKMLALAITAVVALSAVGFTRWVCSDGDLDAVAAYARGRGIALDERFPPQPPPAAPWRAVIARLKALVEPDLPVSAYPKPGQAPPSLLVPLRAPECLAASREVVATMMGLLADGADGPRDAVSMHAIGKLLSLRLLVAPPEDVHALATVASRCAGHFMPLRSVVRAIAYRLGDCRRAHVRGGGLAGSADAVLARWNDSDYALDVRTWYRQSREEAWAWRDAGDRIEQRWTRAPRMEFWVDWLAFTGTRPQIEDLIARARVLPAAAGWWQRTRDAAVQSRKAIADSLSDTSAQAFHARALAAILDRKPLPADPCDPAGGAMRTRRIDGRITTIWSIGFDGIDDGGVVGKDWVLEVDPVDPDADD